ncbi:hypothetical protein WICPIJ_001632 [Wickerhamomyces pijperi]|uniref:Alpha/beta hydrolase fold-3 domain-containing protein n=1 Tax=Wickerhamomyces pijperi TaxID=599730 RepID=A0A9P8QD59_WICPI|nr:hypothetical protein WICPIJ_001632 [Wickerhamomyces pijperi]
MSSPATTYPWNDPEIRKHYHPKLIEMYEENEYAQYLAEHPVDVEGLSEIEKLRKNVAARFNYSTLKGHKYPVEELKDEIDISDSTITSYDGFEIPIKIYKHKTRTDTDSLHINYHGGGFSLGGGLTFDTNNLILLCAKTGVTIIDVDYRLVPEHHYTVSFLDGFAVFKYISEHPEKFGINRNKISVGGASAGGKLSSTVGHLARDFNLPLKLVIANVPPGEDYSKHPDMKTVILNENFIKFNGDPGNTYSTVRFFEHFIVLGQTENPTEITDNLDKIEAYFGRIDFLEPLQKYHQGDLYLSPNFQGLASHAIITAENDVLGSAGLGYAKKLIDNLIPVQVKTIKGLGHGWSNQGGIFKEAEEGLFYLAKLLKDVENDEIF